MTSSRLSTRHLFDLDFVNAPTVEPVAQVLFSERTERPDRWRCVVTPNVDHLVRYARHPEEAEAAAHSSLVLPDGMPIIWASRLLHRSLAGRLTGADLFADLWRRIVEDATPIVVVASTNEVASRISAADANARCIVPPMFDASDRAAVDGIVNEVANEAERIDARFVVVGVSMPKHHRIANGLRSRWAGAYSGTPTVLLLGASPDFALGLTERAPSWMQRSGLEWLHRLLVDPRRMAKRYLVDDVSFLRLVWQEWRSSRAPA